jgi:hypothetical protein
MLKFSQTERMEGSPQAATGAKHENISNPALGVVSADCDLPGDFVESG